MYGNYKVNVEICQEQDSYQVTRLKHIMDSINTVWLEHIGMIVTSGRNRAYI